MPVPESYRESWSNSAAFESFDERRLLVAPALEELFAGVLDRNFETGDRLVEVGAGAGALRNYSGSSRTKFNWIETDHKQEFLTLPRQAGSLGVTAALPELPFASGSLDGIIGLGVFDTLSTYDLENTASEASRALRIGGKAIHVLDMSPDYLAEIKNSKERRLFPLVYKESSITDTIGISFIALKNLPRRIDRLPVEQSLKNVFRSLVDDPETYVPLANRTGILFYLGAVAEEYGMAVEHHSSWYDFMGQRFSKVFTEKGFRITHNGLVTAATSAEASELKGTDSRRDLVSIIRAQGVVSLSSLANGGINNDPVVVATDSHVFVAEKC